MSDGSWTRRSNPVEERKAKLQALREMLAHSIAQGGDVTDAELDAALNDKAAELEAQGF